MFTVPLLSALVVMFLTHLEAGPVEFEKREFCSALIGSSFHQLYIKSLSGSGSVIPTPHLENAITQYRTCVPLSDSLSMSGLVGHPKDTV